jgi:hypothetical protein
MFGNPDRVEVEHRERCPSPRAAGKNAPRRWRRALGSRSLVRPLGRCWVRATGRRSLPGNGDRFRRVRRPRTRACSTQRRSRGSARPSWRRSQRWSRGHQIGVLPYWPDHEQPGQRIAGPLQHDALRGRDNRVRASPFRMPRSGCKRITDSGAELANSVCHSTVRRGFAATRQPHSTGLGKVVASGRSSGSDLLPRRQFHAAPESIRMTS